MTTTLPVLWSASVWDEDWFEKADQMLAWAQEDGLDPSLVVTVEVVVLDAPCLRITRYVQGENGLLVWRGKEPVLDVTLAPLRTWPPA